MDNRRCFDARVFMSGFFAVGTAEMPLCKLESPFVYHR